MSGGPRPLPPRPSLRYLKLEAKRRLAAGEFPALHHAQVAIAWEHGLPSWAALKPLTSTAAGPAGPALAQLRWVQGRFRDAGEPGWAAPGDDELRQHFTEPMLAAVPAASLVAMIGGVAASLRQDLVVVGQERLVARVRLGVLELAAAAEAAPPHRLAGLRVLPYSGPVRAPRVAAPPPGRATGQPPAGVAELADQAVAEHGLPGLVLAGAAPGAAPWVLSRGWADLDRGAELDPGHLFPAYCASVLVTATAVLRLVADGRAGLDTPANQWLRTVRLADGTITIRELLSHTAGVDNPNPGLLLADRVPDLTSITGPVLGCAGPRGVIRPSNGGYAVLGQLIADVTGAPYPDAVRRLVLGPLGLAAAAFPARQADLGPGAVTGYTVIGNTGTSNTGTSNTGQRAGRSPRCPPRSAHCPRSAACG